MEATDDKFLQINGGYKWKKRKTRTRKKYVKKESVNKIQPNKTINLSETGRFTL